MTPLIENSAALIGLWAVIGYLLGSIPFGMVLARMMGLGNLRTIGSGNIGATNVLRTGNKLAAALTLILDGGKGVVAVLAARAAGGEDLAQIAGLAAMIGHCYPVWLRFAGGKGVATFLGIVLALAWPVRRVRRGRGRDRRPGTGGVRESPRPVTVSRGCCVRGLTTDGTAVD